MRLDILNVLRDARDAYVSGEEIAKHMQVSRTAIWKHIRELRQAGYEIESHSRMGYRLIAAPDLLLPEELNASLKTARFGRTAYHFREVVSTNFEAKRLALEGAPEGTVAITETQSGGRGRLSRGWFSPESKGIWFSIVLRPQFLPHEAPKCTLLAAVAVARGIKVHTGIRTGIKWPNDVLYEGKKLVGILTEMHAEMDRIDYIVIGTGINVNIEPEIIPDDLREVMTSLLAISGKRFSRKLLFSEVLKQMEMLYDEVLRDGFGCVLDAWRQYSVTLGQPVKVIGLDRTFNGTAKDIDSEGALLVETETGIERVLAGDVSIRPYMPK